MDVEQEDVKHSDEGDETLGNIAFPNFSKQHMLVESGQLYTLKEKELNAWWKLTTFLRENRNSSCNVLSSAIRGDEGLPLHFCKLQLLKECMFTRTEML